MSWWKSLFRSSARTSLKGRAFRVASSLYSRDGKRNVEILEFDNKQTYIDERDWVDGTTFRNRHSGNLVGPFESNDAAEQFIVGTEWFNGGSKGDRST